MANLDPRPPLPYCIDFDDRSVWVITRDRNGFPRRALPAMAALLHSAGRQTPNVLLKNHYVAARDADGVPELVQREGVWADCAIDLTETWRAA